MDRRPLAIAHVTAERGFSGGEVQVFLLAEGLRARGHHCVLVCPAGSRSEAEARRRGFDVEVLGALRDWSPFSVSQAARALRAARPDVVHLHTQRAAWIGGVAATRLRLPALATRRMDRPMKRGWRNRFIYGRAARLAVAISKPIAGQLADCGLPEAAIRVVPSAVDPARLVAKRTRGEVRRALGAASDEPCVLSVASLHRRKGLDVLLDAVSRLGARSLRPKLWIAGEGPGRGALEARVRKLGLAAQVTLLGQRDDVADLLLACDVFALASRREGLGVAALEAMALGRPIAASRVGGLADAVGHDEAGLLVAPGDAAALAEALGQLVGDPALRRRLGDAGRARVAERHSAAGMVSAYEGLYAEVLA